jgi:DNA-binding phage protein
MITERIQEAIRNAGMTRYAIWKATGVGQDHLCHFLAGKSSMSFATADKILDALGLEIVFKPKCTARKEQ